MKILTPIQHDRVVALACDLGHKPRRPAHPPHLLERLRALQFPFIRAVRGRGLWAGVELDARHVSARAVVERMAERGVLTKDTHETVIRFAPPLTIEREQLDWGIDVFADVLREVAGARTGARLGTVGRTGTLTR